MANFNLRLLEPLLGLLRTCEVHCVAGCCGRDAFEMAPEHMQPWIREHGVQQLGKALDQLSEVIRGVSKHRGQIMSGMDNFNSRWKTSSECVEFLREWQRVIIQAAETIIEHPLIDPSWLVWNDATIPKLAQAIYNQQTFDQLPILADALEEAGCTNADILNHCRQPGEHVRGCWVVDLLLGKS